MPRSLKGGRFERAICGKLSLWFSGGKADDWFWRSSQSGGRATVRGRKGKTTTGHYGDVAATCRQGEPLTSLIAFELKRGYSKDTPFDMLDKSPHRKPVTYSVWIKQARASAKAGGCRFWMIIHKRDAREITITFPHTMNPALGDSDKPYSKIYLGDGTCVYTMLFEDWCRALDPGMIYRYLRHWRKR